jgi:hypothetical protein
MRYTANTLAECERPMIRLICDKCGRKGQYRKATLVGKFGPDVLMPDLLRRIADCPQYDPLNGRCSVKYDLSKAELDHLMGR